MDLGRFSQEVPQTTFWICTCHCSLQVHTASILCSEAQAKLYATWCAVDLAMGDQPLIYCLLANKLDPSSLSRRSWINGSRFQNVMDFRLARVLSINRGLLYAYYFGFLNEGPIKWVYRL